MPIRIFQASGHSEINDMEETINAWLRTTKFDVVHLSTAMCQVSDSEKGERWQQLTVTIVY